MRSTDHFSVQLIDVLGNESMDCQHVEAMSPTHAAEIALGETLSLFGSPQLMRARVWRLKEDFTPVSVVLYSTDAPAADDSENPQRQA